MVQEGFNDFKYLLQWRKDSVIKARLKRTKKFFQSLVMLVLTNYCKINSANLNIII